MNIVFCDPQQAVAGWLEEAFADVPEAEAVLAPFEQVLLHRQVDALVSPANSYGLMDGGVDAAIIAYFGTQLQERVQQAILEEWGGEQPVGTCLAVDTYSNHGQRPHVQWLLHAPTMRVPGSIVGTDNVYRAFRAVLLCARRGGRLLRMEDVGDGYGTARAVEEYHVIGSVLCPGMGTLTGQLPPRVAAAQMRLAWDSVMQPAPKPSWELALQREKLIEGATRA